MDGLPVLLKTPVAPDQGLRPAAPLPPRTASPNLPPSPKKLPSKPTTPAKPMLAPPRAKLLKSVRRDVYSNYQFRSALYFAYLVPPFLA